MGQGLGRHFQWSQCHKGGWARPIFLRSGSLGQAEKCILARERGWGEKNLPLFYVLIFL